MNNEINPLVGAIVGKALAGDQSNRDVLNNRRDLDSALTTQKQKFMAADMATLEAENRAAEENALNWGGYAGRLRVNLEARKMSEATLLAELKKANVQHPLATQEGFEALFEKALAEQYARVDANRDAFGDAEEANMRQSVEGGRPAVR